MRAKIEYEVHFHQVKYIAAVIAYLYGGRGLGHLRYLTAKTTVR